MEGIGRDCVRDNFSPRCKARSKYPASRRAVFENGCVCTSPCNHTNSLSFGLITIHPMSFMTYRQVHWSIFPALNPRFFHSDLKVHPTWLSPGGRSRFLPNRCMGWL